MIPHKSHDYNEGFSDGLWASVRVFARFVLKGRSDIIVDLAERIDGKEFQKSDDWFIGEGI